MKKLNSLGMSFFTFLAISFLFMGTADLLAQPVVEEIQRFKPSEQNTENSEIYWKVIFSNPINGKTVDLDDFKLTIESGSFEGSESVVDVWDETGEGYEWIVQANEVSSKDGTIRLDFVGYVENTKGTGTSKGYSFEKGETYIYGDGGGSSSIEVSQISRFNPGQQNNYARDLTWIVYFSGPIDGGTLDTKDFTLTRTSTANGSITQVDQLSEDTYLVYLTSTSGTGNLRLDFTGKVTSTEGSESKNSFVNGDQYSFITPIAVTSINRYSPSAQQIKANSVTYRVIFSRSMNASSVTAADFQMTALAGQLSGAITSVTGSGTTFYVTVSGITKDVTLRINGNGSFTDSYALTNSATFYTGETYIIDITPPVLLSANIESSNANIRKAIPENTVTVTFNTNEVINILSATINGKVVPHKGTGTTGGSSEYTYTLLDPQGPATFTFLVADNAGNTTTFNKTTDGSFVNFEIPVPDVVIIEQPRNVVACEGSIDKYLFVVAAPDLKGYNIAYRWWKDGRPITDWVQDFGQLSLDTLRFRMSGTYKAEMFVFNPRYDGGSNGDDDENRGEAQSDFSYEEARISSIVFSDDVNLYVLQKPSFLRDIKSVTAGLGANLSLTFDAQIYGEHNMQDPTYWTQIQWFRGTTPLTDNERYEGTKSSILNIENVNATDYAANYNVRLVGECDTVWSNNFAISVEPYASITVQPTLVDGCIGDVVQISIEADATLPTAVLAYQWLVDGVAITDEAGKFNGTNSPDLNVTLNTDLAYNGTEAFTCKVWPVGFPNNGAESNPGTITWKSAPVLTMDLDAAYTAKEDDKVVLAITATGDNLVYTWTKDGVDLNNNTDTYTIDMVAMTDAGDYVATVTNDCDEVTSTTATLAVTAGPIITSVNANVGLGLSQNYPNPFGDNTTLTINSQISGNATVVMTDMLGNVVANLHNGHVGMNTQTTININANEMNLISGTYFITLRMGDKVETRQISVVR